MLDDKFMIGVGILCAIGVIGLITIKYMVESALRNNEARTKSLTDIGYTVKHHDGMIKKIEEEFERIEQEIAHIRSSFVVMEKSAMQERFELKNELKNEITEVSNKVSILIERIDAMFNNKNHHRNA
jgi:hypothetical protein